MSPDMGPDGPMAEALKGLLTSLKTKPDAILIISAHWESKGKAVSVTPQEKPGLLFDYYGTKLLPANNDALLLPLPLTL